MSLFGQSAQGGSNTGGSGGGGLFPALSLNTSVSGDQPGKRRSIFETSSQPQAQGGTFGAPATTSGSSPFGSTTTATAAPSGSLFGSAGNSNTSTANNLFNTPATTTGSSGGLFGNAAATTSAPSGGGLFSGLNASKPATTSIFGQPAATTSQATPSIPSFSLGGTTQQPAAGNSFFGGSYQAPGSVNQTAAQTQAMNSLSRSQNTEPAYFSSLLERQKKKLRVDNGQSGGRMGQLPSVNMDLGDLARRAQELGRQGQNVSTPPSKDSRAHYLLSGSGVVPGKAYRDFQALDGEVAIQQRAVRSDIADESSAYLKGIQVKGREAMLRESMDRVYREFDAFVEDSLAIDFEEQKQRIMEHLGLIRRDEAPELAGSAHGGFGKTRSTLKGRETTRSVFGRSAMDKSMIGHASSVSGTASFFNGNTSASASSGLTKHQTMRDLRDKERIFAEKVGALNQARLEEKTFPVLREFASVEETTRGETPKQLVDAYIALQEITKENSSEAGVKERHFAQSYLQDTDNSDATAGLRKQILHSSRRYLEKAFWKELESVVEKNPRAAQVGGMPTVINKIRAYIRVRAERHDLAPDGSELQQIGDNGDYCWIMIFYLLRSGHVRDAVEYVNSDPAFQSTDRRFVSYLTSYSNSPDRRLGRKVQEMIDGEYQQRTKIAPKGTVDPYRMACYKVIGRCDLSQRNLEAVGQGVEDWLWLQFCLARETDRFEELTSEIFGLEQICETVNEIGQKHFPKGQTEGSSSYGVYLLMQVLAGMFEQAVDYLQSFNPTSAVHLAIALNYYGLLRVSDYNAAGNELLTFTSTQLAQINFVPLIAYYTTTFRIALPISGVDYLSLICLNSDVTPASMGAVFTGACHECLRELCLETREFAALLGDIRGDGSRVAGAIEKRAKLIRLDSHEAFLRSITAQAASIADQRGQTADAVLLYHLCDDYDNVANVLARTLADAVSVELGDSPVSLQPLKPRSSTGSQGSSDTVQTSSSLSLTQSTSSPVELAKRMMGLYDSNAAYYGKISNSNRATCKALLKMLSARAKIESASPQYLLALEELNSLTILPLDAHGDVPTIRQMAAAFGSLPQLVARCAGLCILWCVRSIGGERDRLAQEGSWSATGAEDDMTQLREQLGQMAKDLMVFAGLVKYKLPGRVYDLLTRAGGDVGGY